MDSLFLDYGKIGVVVGVILIIFLLLIYFLIKMDLRLKKLEKETKRNN